MSRISEKVAYLDGLMEGLNIHEDKYAKLFTAIVDTLDVIAEEMSDHEDALADLDDSVEEIFENLDEYDDFLYGDEDEDERKRRMEAEENSAILGTVLGVGIALADLVIDSLTPETSNSEAAEEEENQFDQTMTGM